MLKAAVIGVGSMGRNHARVYREMENEVSLVGVVDTDSKTAAKVGATFSAKPYTDYVEMIEEAKPDVVSLAAPTSLHCKIGCDLLRRGVNVLVEKPIAVTVKEGETMIETAQQAGMVLAVGHIERFNPVVIELRRRLREGMAGRVYKIHAQRLSPYPSRIYDAGVVIDLASHDIDLLRYLMQDEIVRLYGETLQTINSDREDLFSGLVRFRSGAVGDLDVNWITPTKVRRLTVTGSRGMFRCDLISQELYFYENEIAPSQWDTLSILRGVSEGNVLGIRINRVEPLASELSDFVKAVKTGSKPLITGEDGLETLKVAYEFINSGKTHEVVQHEALRHLQPVEAYVNGNSSSMK
jgi:predicted dehydrogenase